MTEEIKDKSGMTPEERNILKDILDGKNITAENLIIAYKAAQAHQDSGASLRTRTGRIVKRKNISVTAVMTLIPARLISGHMPSMGRRSSFRMIRKHTIPTIM